MTDLEEQTVVYAVRDQTKNVVPPSDRRPTSLTDINYTYVDAGTEFTKDKYEASSVAQTIIRKKDIIANPEHATVLGAIRWKIVIILMIQIILSPLIFRFVMGVQPEDSDRKWGHQLDVFDYILLTTLWLGLVAQFIRDMPLFSGTPTKLESSSSIECDGVVSMGLVSPFAGEADVILLRNLLGRTVTALKTVDSRHNLVGLYVDMILNERRVKLESQRKKLWVAWMKFLNRMVDICIRMKENEQMAANSVDIQTSIKLPSLKLDNLYPAVENASSKNSTYQSHFRNLGKTLSRNHNAKEFESIMNWKENKIPLSKGFKSAQTPYLLEDTSLEIAIDKVAPDDGLAMTDGTPDPVSQWALATLTGGSARKISKKVSFKNSSFPLQTPRERNVRATEPTYTIPTGIENMTIEKSFLKPLVNFLNEWLATMAKNEWAYNYFDNNESTEKFFTDCPFLKCFDDEYVLPVHVALEELAGKFLSVEPDAADPKLPMHEDEVMEVVWNLTEDDYPSWKVVWAFGSRKRLRQLPRDSFRDPVGPDPVYQSHRIKPGAIIYNPPNALTNPANITNDYFKSRKYCYKVDYYDARNGLVYAYPFVYPEAEVVKNIDVTNQKLLTKFKIEDVTLIEKNRGKTGAVNFFNEYLRCSTALFLHNQKITHKVQTLCGIVDARHAIIMPDTFWNDALPYFAKLDNEPNQGYLGKHSICISVQYPQYFTNVDHSTDYLDNANWGYYNIGQPIRDCASVICSSGSNTVWDISHPHFHFCQTSRSEDLGTSHEYIPHCLAIAITQNVASGIAKKTEDFLDALYRWSAGPLELLCIGIFQWKIVKHFLITALPIAIFFMACFYPVWYWYYIYLGMVVGLVLYSWYESYLGLIPLRNFVVSTVVTINFWGWINGLLSVVFLTILPIKAAIFSKLPLASFTQMIGFWGLTSVVVSLLTGIKLSYVVDMVKYIAPQNKDINYSVRLWRLTQVYSISFMYTLMSVIAGLYSAYKAYFLDYDLSMWSSFRAPTSALVEVKKKMKEATLFSGKWCGLMATYLSLSSEKIAADLTAPTTMTKWYITVMFLFQLFSISYSTFSSNFNDVGKVVIVLFICGLNLLMMTDAVMLLQPSLSLFGYPPKTEYIYGLIGIFLIVQLSLDKDWTGKSLWEAISISPGYNGEF